MAGAAQNTQTESADRRGLTSRARVLLAKQAARLQRFEADLAAEIESLSAAIQLQSTIGQDIGGVFDPRLAELEQEVARYRLRNQESDQALRDAHHLLTELAAEREKLQAKLDGKSSEPARPEQSEENERLQRRLEMAMQEIRELKGKLRENKSTAPSSTSGRNETATPSAFDWESQKQRLLQQLETDLPSGDESTREERLKIELVIRRTDKLIAEKDRTIDELRQQLEDATAAPPAVLPDNKSSQLLDADELIRNERATLRKMQNEWQEKLRQAEVEISIERAKLAREKTTLEERLRQYELSRMPTAVSSSGTEAKKPTTSRWLARLGLSGEEK